MKATIKKLTPLAVALALAVGCLSACSAGQTGAIALLLPESKATRYESFDRPIFQAKVEELGGGSVMYSNADQDPAKQQQQAESALASGAKVLVLDPVDAKAGVSIVSEANAQGVPVISYDRLIAGGSLAYYISFDNERVGELQGQALVDQMRKKGDSGGIIMVNGSPTDSNAAEFKAGAHKVIDGSGFPVLSEYDTPDWSPDKAQDWVSGQISQYGNRISGIYAANDGVAGGAIAAAKSANLNPYPTVTGQDAELSGIQRVVSGDQYMTVYKAVRAEAEKAAEIAVALAAGSPPSAETTVAGTPATLLTPVVVTVGNIKETVIDDGFYTVDEICTPAYVTACKAAGLE
jgi:D-xylose transport system substrate-binding protein